MPELWVQILALLQIAFIDLVLAGDNAIVVGLAVAGLPVGQRRRAILLGLTGAVILRILFSIVALRLLAGIGLTAAGGILLVWVAWRLFRDLRAAPHQEPGPKVAAGRKTLRSAVLAIVVADVSMSLDNALAVAGAARDNIKILIAGLSLSVALMAVASDWVARWIERRPWLGYIGLFVVITVAVDMIVRGTREIAQAL